MEGVREIAANSFSGTEIIEIIIPKSVKSIGNEAFYDCKNLTSVILQEGLESIGDDCFSNTAIEEIVIPKSVTNINPDSFPDDTVILRPADYHPEGVLTARMARDQL